jgi:hypothetical protein
MKSKQMHISAWTAQSLLHGDRIGRFMRYKLDVEKLSDDQLVDLVEKTVKESGELQHNLSRFTFERLVEVDEKVKACVDELERRGKIHLIKKYL